MAILRTHPSAEGGRYVPFALREDYPAYVDGRSRLDGVRTFLASRGITLPEDGPDAAPHALTVAALGDRKEHYFLDYIRTCGITAYPSTIALLESLRPAGTRTAVVSASRNCAAIVKAAGAAPEARADGVHYPGTHLAGCCDRTTSGSRAKIRRTGTWSTRPTGCR
ncbi:hypothetical protein ACFQZ2_02170 [Streptomonospora algeriensis]|uniref:Uncharacterized protein n=1 Tax=Streptomonospora algeriensis TaxID=995084 RepID=A0ABW3B9U1_9ACTN